MFCFFFSSRRRHTRWPRDWSSDVCSSDLEPAARELGEDGIATGTEPLVELILQLVQRHVIAVAQKDAVEDRAFMRRKSVGRFEPMQRVRRAAPEQPEQCRVLLLLYAQVP